MKYNILLVDDELEMCLSLSELLTSEGYSVIYKTDPSETMSILKNEKIDLIIMDIKMPNIMGLDLLKSIKMAKINIPIIMITGYPSVQNAVKAMKYGASNFFVKPPRIDELLFEIGQLLKSHSEKKNTTLNYSNKIVTVNPFMQKIIKTIERAAPTDAPVFITGESGTGKELVANHLHDLSKRSNKSFIKLNCAAIPDTLLESELFGHEKGSFTDAFKQRKGRFELADKGTIFLDEIGDMSLNTQAKILRVLQEQEFERVGGSEIIKTDIRVISATNKDIKKLIDEEKFRKDLYYRLSVITIHLPPLRERKDDIIPLTKHFINYFNDVYCKEIKDISCEVEQFFLKHDWPGNIRELMNCIERAVIFCDNDIIIPDDLPTQYVDFIEEGSIDNYEEAFNNLNKEIILDALMKSNGIKQKAAELLNINRRTLYNRMKKLGLE